LFSEQITPRHIFRRSRDDLRGVCSGRNLLAAARAIGDKLFAEICFPMTNNGVVESAGVCYMHMYVLLQSPLGIVSMQMIYNTPRCIHANHTGFCAPHGSSLKYVYLSLCFALRRLFFLSLGAGFSVYFIYIRVYLFVRPVRRASDLFRIKIIAARF
jgi:hypothetical protein